METPAPISFSYNYADYQALNRLMRREHWWRRRSLMLVPLGAALAILSVAILLTAIDGRNIGNTVSVALTQWYFWAFVAASPAFVWILNEIELRVFYRRQRIDQVLISVSVDDATGITSQGPTGTGILPWSAIRKLVSDKDAHVVLYENRAMGLCLPRRAFATQQAFDDFAAYVAARMAATKSA